MNMHEMIGMLFGGMHSRTIHWKQSSCLVERVLVFVFLPRRFRSLELTLALTMALVLALVLALVRVNLGKVNGI